MSFKPSFSLLYIFFLFLAATCRAANDDFKWRVVWPLFYIDGPDAEGSSNQAITDKLNELVNNQADSLYVSRSTEGDTSRTWFWYAYLNSDEKATMQGFAGVRLVTEPWPFAGGTGQNKVRSNMPIDLPKRTPIESDAVLNRREETSTHVERDTSNFILDDQAPSQLRVVSIMANTPLANAKGYKYEDSAGAGIHIYVLDTGTTPSHPEFAGRDVSWIFGGPFALTDEDDLDDAESHGTCMTAVAMGNTLGVARKASLTAVQIDSKTGNGLNIVMNWIDALAKVYDDILKNKRSGKAVISMSTSLDAFDWLDQNYQACFADALTTLLELIDKEDVPEAVAVPNEGTEINVYPAQLILPLPNGQIPLPNLIGVGGAVVDSGDYFNDIRNPELKVYGPADNRSGGGPGIPGLVCAVKSGNYVTGSRGNSIATAMTAGLLAYFMGQDNTGANARQNLFNTVQVRKQNGPGMIWNELDASE